MPQTKPPAAETQTETPATEPRATAPQTGPPAGQVAVRLTIRPDEITHVPEDDVQVIRQQGLLFEDPEVTAATLKPSGATAGTGKDPA